MRLLRRLARNDKGVAAVEFAFIALPFFVMVVGAIQLMVVLLTQQLLETATEAVGRKILTGYVQQSALTQPQFVTLACSLLPVTMNCKRLIIDVNVASSFSGATVTRPSVATLGNPTTTTVLTYNPGVRGQIVVLRMIYALPVVAMPGFNLQQSSYGLNYPMATAVFKNETY